MCDLTFRADVRLIMWCGMVSLYVVVLRIVIEDISLD